MSSYIPFKHDSNNIGVTTLKHAYSQYVENYSQLPQLKGNNLRCATFNVHFWTDLYEIPSFEALLVDIQRLNADVLCLQEVSFTSTRYFKLSQAQLEHELHQLGYQHLILIKTQPYLGGEFGNLIASKVPIMESKSGLLHQGKGKVKRGYCLVTLLDSQLTICCVHLDVFDKTGQTRNQQLTELLQKVMIDINPTNLIICGDFNATRVCDYSPEQIQDIQLMDVKRGEPTDVTTLLQFGNMGFQTCFDQIQQQNPNCSVWSCRVIDYIFVAKTFAKKIHSCGIYLTQNSDHCAIYLDIN